MKTTPIPDSLALATYFKTTPDWLTPKRRGRFIENQYFGAEVHRSGDRDALPLTARERPERLIYVIEVDSEVGQLLRRRCPHVSDIQGLEHGVLRESPSRGRNCARFP